MTIISRNDEKGRSMIEMLGVLAIIGVLSVGGISGYSKAMAKFKLTKAQDQITMLLMNIRTAFAASPSYKGLDNKMAVDINIAPRDMVVGSNKIMSAFGGPVTVKALKDEAYFAISLENLGKEACISLLTSDWGSDGLIGIQLGTGTQNPEEYPASSTESEAQNGITTGTSSWLVKDNNADAIKVPVPFASAVKTCGSNAAITWFYY